MITAIIVLLLVVLALQLSIIRPTSMFADPPPVDRDRERQLDEVRAHR